MIRWVFFDIGWTLVDETQMHRRRWQGVQDLLARCGIECSVADLMGLMVEASTAFARSPFLCALERLGLSDGQREKIVRVARCDHKYEIFYPGACEMLPELARAYSLGIIANQSHGTYDRLVERGIASVLSVVVASAELGVSKPDPRIFEAAIGRAGCEPHEAVMVGDRLDNDIGPAKRLGWRTIRVRQGLARFQQPRESAEQADCTIETISELPGVLAKSFRGGILT